MVPRGPCRLMPKPPVRGSPRRDPNPRVPAALLFSRKALRRRRNVGSALDAVPALNAQGITATLDFLGEDVSVRAEAERTRDAYLEMLNAIRARGVETNVSVKLTAMGLLIDDDLALENLRAVVERAATTAIPSSASTWKAPPSRRRRCASSSACTPNEERRPGPAGLPQAHPGRRRARDRARRSRPALQGRLQRAGDIAYKTCRRSAATTCAARKRCSYAATIPGIATHDERLIQAVKTFTRERNITKDRFEFQLLYGVRPELQRRLVDEGYRVASTSRTEPTGQATSTAASPSAKKTSSSPCARCCSAELVVRKALHLRHPVALDKRPSVGNPLSISPNTVKSLSRWSCGESVM